MNPVTRTPETALRDALEAFETSVAMPVIPGELPDWVDKVKKSWRAASSCIQEHTQVLHPQQFKEIAETDAALLRQVELLQAEDEAIANQREQVNQTIARMAEHLPKFEPDEAKAQPHIENVAEQSIALVARVRKQEVGVQAWFSEAFNRERGGGD
jgi:hypothetical protein